MPAQMIRVPHPFRFGSLRLQSGRQAACPHRCLRCRVIRSPLPPFVGPSAPHAVLWDPDRTPHDLGTPPGGAGVSNVANSINNQGQVAMNSVMLDGTVHAFLWSDGASQDLGTFPQDSPVTVVPCCNNVNGRGRSSDFPSTGASTSARSSGLVRA